MRKVDIRTKRRIKGLLLTIVIIFIVILFTGFNSFKFNRVINVDYQNEINIKYH